MHFFYGTYVFKRLIFVVALGLIISMIVPLLTKLQGQFLNVQEVVVLSWSVLIGALLQFLLKETCIKKLFIVSIVIELCSFATINLFYYDIINVRIFLYLIVLFEALVMWVNGALGLRIRVYISQLYKDRFKDFEFTSTFLMNLTLLFGGIVIFTSLCFLDLKTCLWISSLLYIFMIIVEIIQIKDVLEMQKQCDKVQ